jgi:hypothetical protein
MKKILLSLLAVLYLGISSGIAMDIHYCMGKVSQVDLYGKDNSNCAKCNTAEKKSCCGEKYKFYKLSAAHNTVFNNISFASTSLAIISEYPLYNWQCLIGIAHKGVTNNSPPIYIRRSARIMNCIFRI